MKNIAKQFVGGDLRKYSSIYLVRKYGLINTTLTYIARRKQNV